MLPIGLLVLAFVPMLFEARLDARHARALRQRGAREPGDDVYRFMQVVYPASFLGMVGEAWVRDADMNAVSGIGLAIFVLAKGLKYWAIATLGERWTFRVLVPPGSSRTVTGPYRFVRHPNYIGVMGELIGMGLLAQAPVAGGISVVSFALLLFARIRVEERALGMRAE